MTPRLRSLDMRDEAARPLLFAAMVLAVITVFLGLDRFASADQQLLLGAATWLILIAACAPLSPQGRARVLIVVLVATCAEVLGSIVLGAYTYRLDNLPAFVPPGHGLVYLAGLRISQSRFVREHRRAFLNGVIAIVAAWGVAGLTILGHTDALGALAGALLILVLLRSRNAPIYAGVFLMVGFLEVYGTSVGAWSWAATVPGTVMPAGNPPSGIAGIYVLFDVAAIAAAPALLLAVTRLRHLIAAAGGRPAQVASGSALRS
jgi:hypothetical protein